MTDILIYGDTIRSPEVRHELPLTIPDPFLYAEREGVRSVYISSLEIARLRALGGPEAHPYEEVGYDELIASGIRREEIHKPLVANATVPVKFLVALTITVNIVFLAPFTDCVRGVTDTENSPLPPRLAQLESTAATKKTQQKATPTNGFHGHCFMRILQARV